MKSYILQNYSSLTITQQMSKIKLLREHPTEDLSANLYVFRWYFLSLIMCGALERMALRRILPARRMFSEGTCSAVTFRSNLSAAESTPTSCRPVRQ